MVHTPKLRESAIKQIMLFFDRMPIDDGSTGKEHIGRTSLRAHKKLVENVCVFPIGKRGLPEVPCRQSTRDFAEQEAVITVNRGESKVASGIHRFLLLSLIRVPRSLRDSLAFFQNYFSYAQALADIGTSFDNVGKPS